MKKKKNDIQINETSGIEKKEKRKRPVPKDIRWDRLDNTAHLFPVIAGESMSNVYRISVTLTELIQPEALHPQRTRFLPHFL